MLIRPVWTIVFCIKELIVIECTRNIVEVNCPSAVILPNIILDIDGMTIAPQRDTVRVLAASKEIIFESKAEWVCGSSDVPVAINTRRCTGKNVLFNIKGNTGLVN